MSNPVIVEVTRGGLIESRHRGAIVAVLADGATVYSAGDIHQPVYPRSAVKAIQALPLVESGAADAYAFHDKELALACSSHSGEPAHVALASNMLKRAGLDEAVLECGGHWSSRQPVALAQARQFAQTPGALYNNCSGKHTGFVCTAAHLCVEPAGYIQPDHAIQQAVHAALQDLTGQTLGREVRGTDGCSIPTYAAPLDALARAFARLVTGQGLTRERASAARRLTKACMTEPFFVAGTDRFCTDVMRAGAGRVFVKTGAEGVYCGAIPPMGVGIALKCDDGAVRAAEVMMAAVLAHLLPADDPMQSILAAKKKHELTNWNGMVVGEVRVSPLQGLKA